MEKKQSGVIIEGKLTLHKEPTTHSESLVLIPDATQIIVSEYDMQWYKTMNEQI